MRQLINGLIISFIVVTAVCLVGCTTPSQQSTSADSLSADSTSPQLSDYDYQQDNAKLMFDNSAWHYDEQNNVYWQIGIAYCSRPETTEYENLAIYVPGEYLTAVANGDGSYTCVINTTGTIDGYTSHTAPIVFPVNTGGYSAAEPARSYDYNEISNYTRAGFVYVRPGLRGRDNGYDSNGTLIYSGGAPWGVTDLKAAVRYYRLNEERLPGDTDHIFTFGMSGGGAQSAVMGATGNSNLYDPYLKSIGSAMVDANGKNISDAIFGAMCWCPITSLDYADEAYEWNMGQYASSGSRANDTWTSALSADMAGAYAPYLNSLNLKDCNGTVLRLERSSKGIFASGTYYDHLLSIIEGSLNSFLQDTKFPYTKNAGGFMAGGGLGGGAAMATAPGGNMPGNGIAGGMGPAENMNQPQLEQAAPVTYNTIQEYIASLNSDEEWVKYDAKTNTVKITSIEAFVRHNKKASKSVPAFDDLNRSQAENNLFGNDKSESLHFDGVIADLLEKNKGNYSEYRDWNSSIADAYATDLMAKDRFGNGIVYRLNMYNPMYYVSGSYDGYKTSNPATHWRIRTGIEQGDTALTVETNLALALTQDDSVKDVDFETVWGMGHTTAERSGSSTDNFISWVNKCAKLN